MLRCDIGRTFVIRRAFIVKTLELTLELSLTLLSCFELCALSGETSLLFLRLSACLLPTTLFFLLLDLALTDLLLKGLKASCLCFLLLLEL